MLTTRLLVIVALAAAVTLPQFGFCQNYAVETIVISGKTIQIPLPEGIVRIDGKNADYDRILSSAVPDTNVQKLYAVEAEEAKKLIEANIYPNSQRTYYIQWVRELDGQEFSPEDVTAVLRESQIELEGLIERNPEIRKQLERQFDETVIEADSKNIDVTISQPTITEILGVGENHLSFALVTDVTSTANPTPSDGEAEEDPMIVRLMVGSSMQYLGGTMINLYCMGPLDTEASSDAIASDLESWRTQILAANPDLAPKKPSSRKNRILTTALIGGIAGAAIAVIGRLGKRKKKTA